MIEQCSVWTEGSNEGDKVLHWHDLASCNPDGRQSAPRARGRAQEAELHDGHRERQQRHEPEHRPEAVRVVV